MLVLQQDSGVGAWHVHSSEFGSIETKGAPSLHCPHPCIIVLLICSLCEFSLEYIAAIQIYTDINIDDPR